MSYAVTDFTEYVQVLQHYMLVVQLHIKNLQKLTITTDILVAKDLQSFLRSKN